VNKKEALLRYKTSMALFKQWLRGSVITERDFSEIHTVLAHKYGLSSLSIYL